MQEVSFVLPTGNTWYNYYSKKLEQVLGSKVTRLLPDLEQAVFIRGGTILPKLLHDNCYALSQCYWSKIRLEVYIDSYNSATGSLYTDDGVSFDHITKGLYTIVNFNYNGSLTSKRSEGTDYAFPSSQTIDQIAIYGLTQTPIAVLQNGEQVPSFLMNNGVLLIAMPSQVLPDGVNIELVYN